MDNFATLPDMMSATIATTTGALVIRIAIGIDPVPSGMSPQHLTSLRMDRAAVGATDGPSLAGSIARDPESIESLIDQWAAHMRRKGKATNTVGNYVPNVKRMARECGWFTVDDLSIRSVEEWHERVGAEWKSTTFNRYVAASRAFGEWLWRVQRVTESPFARLEYASKAGEQGSRAATTDEAKAWLLDSMALQGVGRATKGNPTLFGLLEMLAGMRGGDAKRLTWGMIDLDAEIPHVAWDSRANKGKRSGFVALAPELADELRKHRDAMRALAAEQGPSHGKTVKGGKRVERPFRFKGLGVRGRADRPALREDPRAGGHSPVRCVGPPVHPALDAQVVQDDAGGPRVPGGDG